MAVITAEFGLYWLHRIAHERLFFWRFHALHHSVTRLWVINTGHFHIGDSLFKVALSQVPLYLLGAPLELFWWLGAVTAFMGILTHCNVDMRTGFFDYAFSTPRLHHSKEIREGNTNYGTACSSTSCSALISIRTAHFPSISVFAARSRKVS